MGTEKFNMFVLQYPESFEVSKNKRAIYIHESEGKRIPKNILKNPDKYSMDALGFIIDNETKERIIRNKKTANKPSSEQINGQSLWNGNIAKYKRNKLKNFLSNTFSPLIVRQLPEKLFTAKDEFFHFEFIFYTPISLRGFHTVQDIDNHQLWYTKAFLDCLVELKIIPDDNAMYYRGIYSRYVDIEDPAERRLEIKIHFCKNTERIHK